MRQQQKPHQSVVSTDIDRAAVRVSSDELDESTVQVGRHYRWAGSMNDNNNNDGVQVTNDVITHVTSSSSSSSQLDQWLAEITQRQHGAADRLTANKLSCDCTFCVPDVANTLTNFRSSKTTSPTTTTSSKPVFTCGSCARSFASEKYLNMHAALHRKSAGSTRSSVMSVQALTLNAGAGPKEKWTCEVCGKIFAHTSNYKNHIRTHSDERPFVCHVCSIGFKERYHLKKHTLFKHTGELNEVCRRCGKRFKDSTAVRAHERIHSDARPYTCQRCGKAFKTSECLWHHDHRSKTCGRPRRTTERPPILSTTCQTVLQPGDSLASLSDLVDQSDCYVSLASVDIKSFPPHTALSVTHDTQQSAVKTEDAVFMLNCDGIKNDNSELMTPAVAANVGIPWLSHSTKPVAVVIGQHVTGSGIKQRSICSRCGKQFASSLAFERHLAVHSITRPYRCHICDVGFKLKVHLKKHNLYRHNSDYPCQCRVCGKPFKDSSAVRLHERIHSSARPFQCACGKSFKTRENLWGHRHRRPCIGRYTSCATACLGGATQSTHDTRSCVQPSATLSDHGIHSTSRVSAFDADDAAALTAVTDSLLMFDATADCINVDSKLLPPFETFIPPLRPSDTSNSSAPLLRCHSYADWSTAAGSHDVIWWSSAPSNYQPSSAMMTSHPAVGDVTDDVRVAGDWSSSWQLSRKLSM